MVHRVVYAHCQLPVVDLFVLLNRGQVDEGRGLGRSESLAEGLREATEKDSVGEVVLNQVKVIRRPESVRQWQNVRHVRIWSWDGRHEFI